MFSQFTACSMLTVSTNMGIQVSEQSYQQNNIKLLSHVPRMKPVSKPVNQG